MVSESMILSARVRDAKSAHLKDLEDIAGQLNLINTVLGVEGLIGICFEDIEAGISILHSSIYEMINTLTDDSQKDD